MIMSLGESYRVAGDPPRMDWSEDQSCACSQLCKQIRLRLFSLVGVPNCVLNSLRNKISIILHESTLFYDVTSSDKYLNIKCAHHLATKDSNVRKISGKYQHIQAWFPGLRNSLTLLKTSKNLNVQKFLFAKKKKKSCKLLGQLNFVSIKTHGGF